MLPGPMGHEESHFASGFHRRLLGPGGERGPPHPAPPPATVPSAALIPTSSGWSPSYTGPAHVSPPSCTRPGSSPGPLPKGPGLSCRLPPGPGPSGSSGATGPARPGSPAEPLRPGPGASSAQAEEAETSAANKLPLSVSTERLQGLLAWPTRGQPGPRSAPGHPRQIPGPCPEPRGSP